MTRKTLGLGSGSDMITENSKPLISRYMRSHIPLAVLGHIATESSKRAVIDPFSDDADDNQDDSHL